MKQHYFVSGLPRAGNTLFGSIMNQNPDVAVTGNSWLFPVYADIVNIKFGNSTYLNFPDEISHSNVVDNIYPNYFKHWKQKHIIERVPISPAHIKNMMAGTKTFPKLKIILLLRPILEVVASFIKWSETGEAKGKPKDMFKFSPTRELKVEQLMNPNQSNCGSGYVFTRNIMASDLMEYILPVHFNDLTYNTKETIERVYDFLEIPKFKHRFNNLQQFKVNNQSYDDGVYGDDLHTIKTDSIDRDEYHISKYVPEDKIKKYQYFNHPWTFEDRLECINMVNRFNEIQNIKKENYNEN